MKTKNCYYRPQAGSYLSAIAAALVIAASACAAETRPLVIAHRGASGYLPEHTLAAKTLAYGLGADFLEQDLVLTKDDVPVVLHDIYVDTVTDVAKRFPERKRADGRFYALDFTLAELKQLRVASRAGPRHQSNRAADPRALRLRHQTGRLLPPVFRTHGGEAHPW